MLYRLKMIGTYIGAVKVDDKKVGQGYVLVNIDKYVNAYVYADSIEEGIEKLYETSDNAEKIEVVEEVPGTFRIALGAHKYATPEQIALVEERIDHIEIPSDTIIAKHSLQVDVINAIME